MKEVLTPVQWAENLNKVVRHTLFGEVLLVGIRTQCEENKNLMLNIKCIAESRSDAGEYFWVYDYQTYPLEYAR